MSEGIDIKRRVQNTSKLVDSPSDYLTFKMVHSRVCLYRLTLIPFSKAINK